MKLHNFTGTAISNGSISLDPQQVFDVPDLIEMLHQKRPAWTADAACQGQPTHIFYPVKVKGESNKPALEICGRCPVRIECADEAIADPRLDHGIRGGLSPSARQARRRKQRRQEP